MQKSFEKLTRKFRSRNPSKIEPWSAKGSPKGLRVFNDMKFLGWREFKIGPFDRKTIQKGSRHDADGLEAQRIIKFKGWYAVFRIYESKLIWVISRKSKSQV